MARPQYQLPSVVSPQPQAHPTDQFVQSKPNYKIPNQIADLSRFSQTLTNMIAQSQMDAHQRSYAQGEIDATYATPFGSSTPTTPEGEANRKAFKGAQEEGKILPSEDPWYRIGVYTGEGRRAGITMHNALLSDENLRNVSRVYDEQGNFIPFDQREDPEALFARQSAIFLQNPALQSIYGKQAAAQMVEASRAEFVAQVAHRRDLETQMYHETQLSDQTVEQLDRVALVAHDQSPEGRANYKQAEAGLHDLISEWTTKWNLPDGPKVARQGFLAFVDKAAQSNPHAAVEAIDLIRKVKVGPTAVGGDNSEDGVAFRAKLDALETHYNYAAGVEGERQEKQAKLYKEQYLSRVEDGISVGFASGIPPAAVYDKLKARIEHEVEPRFQDEAKKTLDAHYSDALNPLPKRPDLDERLDGMLLTKPVPEIEDWIKGIAGVDVSYGQASDMRKKLQAEAEAWKNLPEVKSSADRFQADAHDFSADRSSSLQDDVRALTNSEVEAANQRIQLRAKNLTGEQRIEQMGGIVKEEYAKATGALDALKKDIQARSVAFDTQFLAARNKRINFEKGITDARSSGLLTRGEFNAANDQNHRASDVSTYTEDPRVQNAVSRLFNDPLSREAALLGKPWATQEDARLRAMEMARQWALTERPKYESQGDADNAFTEFVNTKMRREVASTLGLEGASEPPGPASKPGGPSIPALDQAKDGKDFQVVLDGGDKGALKLAAVKAYPAGSKSPQSLTKFQASFGQANGSMPKIRGDARKDLVAMTRSGQLDQTTRTALLNTGAASPGELLRGAIVENGVTIPIKPEEVDIWKTMVFTSTIQFRKAYNDDRAMLRSLSKMYGVQDADFAVWAKQQGLLLKVNGL